MENPDQEITEVVTLLTAATDPTIQLGAARKFMAPDMGFDHPLCNVPSGPGSREKVLGIYQWYRQMSPTIEIVSESHTWDPEKQVVYLNVVQKFHIWLSPFPPAPARLLVRLTLRKDSNTGLYLIAKQEDFYQPEDLAQLIVPYMTYFIHLAKRGGSITSNICAWGAQTFLGLWKPRITEGVRKA